MVVEIRFHVVGLPHTEVLQDYNQCAYTAKVRKFATMMTRRGHEVILYSSGRNEAQVAEHVQLLDEDKFRHQFRKQQWWQEGNWPAVSWDPEVAYWKRFNRLVAKELKARVAEEDFICMITGTPHAEMLSSLNTPARIVEIGIGYEGIMENTFHVFESYAWMHAIYGARGPSSYDGRFYDTIIHNFFDPKEFPAPKPLKRDPYYLFLSRPIHRKGLGIAADITERLGAKLIVAGTPSDEPIPDVEHIEYVGFVDVKKRGDLLAKATALLCPTIYLEPFGGVVVEAQLCGTPVLTTDFGAFTETVDQGLSGYRCHTLGEFERAAREIEGWSIEHRRGIRGRAQARWSTDVIAEQYETYFDRLEGLRTRGGFYETLEMP